MVKDRETREPHSDLASRLVNALRERRILLSSIGVDNNILKLHPPMVFTKEHADHFLQVFDEVLIAAT